MFMNVDNETVSALPETTDGGTDPETIQSRNNEKCSKVYEEHSKLIMILAGIFFVISVITTTISIVLACKLWSQKKSDGMYEAAYITSLMLAYSYIAIHSKKFSKYGVLLIFHLNIKANPCMGCKRICPV